MNGNTGRGTRRPEVGGKGGGKTQAVGTRRRQADSKGKHRQLRWLEGTSQYIRDYYN
jgi:hypothetical protein